MTNKILDEKTIEGKLKAAEIELQKIEEKYLSMKAKVQSYKAALAVLNELGREQKETLVLQPKKFSEDEKMELVRQAIKQEGGDVHYSKIHAYLNQHGCNTDVSDQATYAFIKRRCGKESMVEFKDRGNFAIISEPIDQNLVNIQNRYNY